MGPNMDQDEQRSTSVVSSPAPGPRATSTLHKIFLGPGGLRAGWRVTIFLLIFVSLLAGLSGVVKLFKGSIGVGNQPALTSFGTGLSAGMLFLFTVIATWVMSRIEKRKFGQYGLPASQAFRKDFWVGLLWGFLATTATVLAIYALHGVEITRGPLHGGTLLASAGAWGLAFLLVGFNEEFAFRGYMQFTLAGGIGFWPSAFLVSGLFALAHVGNRGETIFGELAIVLFGLLLCLFLRLRGNLWWAVGFHLGYDWAETFFWGEPDSGMLPTSNFLTSNFHGPSWLTGGSVGPEASVLTPICLLIVAILFMMVYSRESVAKATPAPVRGEVEPSLSA